VKLGIAQLAGKGRQRQGFVLAVNDAPVDFVDDRLDPFLPLEPLEHSPHPVSIALFSI